MEEEDFIFGGDEDHTGRPCQLGTEWLMVAWMGWFTYLELGRGTASSFFLDFVGIADSDGLCAEL